MSDTIIYLTLSIIGLTLPCLIGAQYILWATAHHSHSTFQSPTDPSWNPVESGRIQEFQWNPQEWTRIQVESAGMESKILNIF